ncbi:DUF4143 domain-containing protein [Petrimonas sp.]|uniref:DUF4143 domain-containing protein n=1 Tax=Petrimonas sp. TaxID=2023866 RepID=UPI003FA73186
MALSDRNTHPVTAYADLSNYKLYMADIGILTLHSKIPLQTMLSPIEVDNIFLGSMAENYVAQSFINRVCLLISLRHKISFVL